MGSNSYIGTMQLQITALKGEIEGMRETVRVIAMGVGMMDQVLARVCKRVDPDGTLFEDTQGTSETVTEAPTPLSEPEPSLDKL